MAIRNFLSSPFTVPYDSKECRRRNVSVQRFERYKTIRFKYHSAIQVGLNIEPVKPTSDTKILC